MHKYINDYRKALHDTVLFGASQNEQSIRPNFINLIKAFSKDTRLRFIDELRDKKNNTIPDGTLKDKYQITYGYYEAKDPKDDLDQEIEFKLHQKNYNSENILFENSKTAVLYQNHKEIRRVNIQSDDEGLETIISQFLNFKKQEIEDFEEAIGVFKENIPALTNYLRQQIEKVQNKTAFSEKRAIFLKQCQQEINANFQKEDIREMIIQHFLTGKLFNTVFSETDFHRYNNIARQIDELSILAFDIAMRKNFENDNAHFYTTLEIKAKSVQDHHDKQAFLKVLYEEFYKAYNPQAADRLGVVYTPREIVNFMIESVDFLLYKYFNTSLSEKNVRILDPATGTGTFIADLIDYIPKSKLSYKYEHEIFANELAVLPYYIASLNIEYTYRQKMESYKEFPNIAFVDTLDNHYALDQTRQQQEMGFTLNEENTQRIRRQNAAKISVIIGNPPYNANQQNYNDHNANRKYPEIDRRIKNTFHKYSTAQKNDYDMYKRFYRWAMDRIDPKKGGIVAFVTNNSFITARRYDGFRKEAKDNFDYVYIVDLGGNIRANQGRNIGNVFGIQTGVCIAFFIKTPFKKNQRPSLFYHTLQDEFSKKDKLEFLSSQKIEDLTFETLYPDKNHNWLNITDNDFESLLPLCSKQTKNTKTQKDEQALFKLFSNGAKSNRDAWVYDFDKKNLEEKVRFLSETYNESIQKTKMNDTIKWSRDLRNEFLRKKKSVYTTKFIIYSLFRPFVKKYYYAEKLLNDVLTENHFSIFGKYGELENKVIQFSGISSSKPFHCLATNALPCFDNIEKGQCLPLYRYDSKGKKTENITDWGLKQFRSHYASESITKEAIFYYVYGVLHDPKYRKTYSENLKRDFPRLPFHENFEKWSEKGKKLMDLHLNYDNLEPYPLKRKDLQLPQNQQAKVKLKADKLAGQIELDSQTSLSGIPETAWQYKLGNRSALEWVLDQYKEKKISDKTVSERFNTYRFSDYKEEVIKLLGQVCRVSVESWELIGEK